MNATTQPATVNVTAKKVMDWAISSQAARQLVEGSTTSAYSPPWAMKRHERGAAMYRKVTGIYAIEHEPSGSVYYGSAVCVTGRLNMHKRELRNGIHANSFLQGMWNKYGDQLTFRLIETCPRRSLRKREQFYIDTARGRLMNLEKSVAELAAPEVHSARMSRAWKNRSQEARDDLAAKISATLKQRYSEDPKFLKAARSALEKGREVLRESGYFSHGIKKAHKAASEFLRARWADPQLRADTIAKIKATVIRTPKICAHCGETFAGVESAKFCAPRCRVAACKARLR